MLIALREAALNSAVPMPSFTFPDTHTPIPAPEHPVEPITFSHAKKHTPAILDENSPTPTAVFHGGRTISRTN